MGKSGLSVIRSLGFARILALIEQAFLKIPKKDKKSHQIIWILKSPYLYLPRMPCKSSP
jgi:hypothetical protein